MGMGFGGYENAAAMDPQQAAQAYQYPVISGFTPVNPSEVRGAAKQPTSDNGASTSKIRGKPKALTRRKTQSFKPRKTAGTRNLKKSKTAGELQCHDISKGLSRTKPAPSGYDVPLVKTAALSELVLSEPIRAADLMRDARVEFERRGVTEPADALSCPSGLSEKYQLAYIKRGGADTLPKPAIVRAGPDSSMGHELLDDYVDEFEEFMIPTSAQGEKHMNIEDALSAKLGSIPPEPVPEKAFNSDEVFSDQDEADEFPMDDEDLEHFIQSIAPTELHNDGPFPDWQPQDLDDDPLASEEAEEHVPSDRIVQASSYPQSEAENAKEPECRTSFDHEGLYQDIALSDKPLPTSSHSSIHQSSCLLPKVLGFGANYAQPQTQEGADNSFDDDELDENLADLAADGSDIVQFQTPLTSPEKAPSSPKLKWMPSKTYTPKTSSHSQVPVPSNDVLHGMSFNENGEPLPFIRPPFPKPIRDRSPILGLTNCIVLRTCFRIGEALNAAAVASQTNTDAIVELYARIILSERETAGGVKQFFQFGDLFTDKPPFLSGTYSLWKGAPLWDVDSKPFLGEKGKGKMARVMGRIKRCEQGGGCEMVILSIWEVDWEDVGVAKDIICS